MPKPVIAAINGTAAGAGLGLACACDFRIGAAGARYTTAFAGIGLTADSGLSWTLPRLVGSGRATALLLLAEPFTAEQALEMGLLNAVVAAEQVLPAAHELAGRLAAGPTAAYACIKESLAVGADVDPRGGAGEGGRAADAGWGDGRPRRRGGVVPGQAAAGVQRPLGPIRRSSGHDGADSG